MKKKLAQFEKKIGYYFKNKNLLLQALTHSSYAYENPQKVKADNETLEFLGDSVLGLIISDYLFANYPKASEGELSKFKAMVGSPSSLSALGKKIRIEKNILLGKGEEKSGGRKKKTILAGSFEALVAALYLDGGFEEARYFLLPYLNMAFKKVRDERFFINNYKSALQEYFQKMSLPSPVYRTVTTLGPDHKKSFVVEVTYNDIPLAKAKAYSKKGAEQKAAQIALKSLIGKKMKALTADTFFLKKKT